MESKLEVEWVEIARLYCSPSNPRRNEATIEPVAASIRRFGWRQPIVAKPAGEVIAGNTRLKAAKHLGLEQVPVVWFEGSDLEATAYQIADIRTSEFAEWDEEALAKLLQELRDEDALDGVGYSNDDIDALLAALEENAEPGEVDDQGPEEPPAIAASRRGDLWILGEHRLLCGDSTNGEDVKRVLAGDKAVLMATDPRYCVEDTGDDRPGGSGKDWSDKYNEVKIKDLGVFLDGVLRAVLPHLKDDAGLYVWFAHRQFPVICRVFEEHKLLLHQPIIWEKPTSTFTHSYYR